ncbi:hypothetical protein ciss_16310 [Carboxydothermus islandicus]|uniref:PucR family transcriptional regulator n=1 Tax=Carboxydothermus islandicus TaxID=661089 RepID=A0A1L8D3F2_9THEO|nr:PucR family transcriptional regulator [Carboxydothermus islandicus]GAV25698.1 hypothetical protein ciss_16310 [Carboxydothermus islandicus]
MEKAYGIPLNEVLEMEAYSGVKVLAGRAGLKRIVTGVNVMEVPDILDWVKPGELLLTTGYAIKDDREAQKNLIPLLAEKGLAGIGIKPRRYLNEIPLLMIAKAEEYNFPLLEIPYNASFSDLISPVLAVITNKQSIYLQKIIDAHRLFTKIIAEGGGLKAIVSQLSMLMKNTVYVEDYINLKQVFVCCGIINEEFAELKAAPVVSEVEKLGTLESVSKTLVEFKGKRIGRYEINVKIGDALYGRIFLWETRAELSEMDLITLERLSAVVALEITKDNSVYQVERRYLNEFIDYLISGNISDEAEVLERGRLLGLDLTLNYGVVLLRPQVLENDVGHLRNLLSREIENYVRKRSIRCFLGTKSGNLILFFAVDEANEKLQEKELKAKAQELKEYLEKFHKVKILAVTGRVHPGIRGLSTSYREAYKTFLIAQEQLNTDEVLSFSDLGIFRLLFSQEQKKEINEYLAETLLPLIEYDREKGTDLLKTLEIYFDCNFNLKKVSERLFTHYNTIVYRLERIREITGIDLENAEERFKLELALKIRNIANFT